MEQQPVELTILMPCLNEAETLEVCIRKARGFLDDHDVEGEILIADNGSDDGSQDIARGLGARVVDVAERGYGNALIAGIKQAYGIYVIMGDADDSYDFSNLQPFLDHLRKGSDLVMGNRFKGGIKKNAMPPLHRYLGNPVLSFVGRLFFPSKIGDFHCGLRGFNREKMAELNLVCGGMEFASEMVVKATLNKCEVAEVPATLSPDGRSRPPHLRSWRDGWRHLRFLLIFSPKWLFFYPGLVLLISGLLGFALLGKQPLEVMGIGFDVQSLLFMSASVITGVQLLSFSSLARSLGKRLNLLPRDPQSGLLRSILTMDRVLVIGVVVFFIGLFLAFASVGLWSDAGYGSLDPSVSLRTIIPSVTLMISGTQIFFSAFFYGIIESFVISKKDR